jgi:hypothetical protein
MVPVTASGHLGTSSLSRKPLLVRGRDETEGSARGSCLTTAQPRGKSGCQGGGSNHFGLRRRIGERWSGSAQRYRQSGRMRGAYDPRVKYRNTEQVETSLRQTDENGSLSRVRADPHRLRHLPGLRGPRISGASDSRSRAVDAHEFTPAIIKP